MLLANLGVIPLMKTVDQIFSVRLGNGGKLSMGSYINPNHSGGCKAGNRVKTQASWDQSIRDSCEQPGRRDRRDLMKKERDSLI